MKRKKGLKRDFPGRSAAFEIIRNESGLREFVMRSGKTITINPLKRALIGKPYVNEDLQREYDKIEATYAFSDEEMNKMTHMIKEEANA